MANEKINKDPFDFLDTYGKEGFKWAEKVWDRISQRINPESYEMGMTSITFAWIYSDFLHVSMNLYRDDFENYLSELYGEKTVEAKVNQSHDYRRKIYKAMSSELGSDYEIFASLKESVMVENEDHLIYPLDSSGEGSALSFVGNKFNF